MRIPGHIFREYDIRGVVEDDLTAPLVIALGRGLGTLFRRAGLSRIGIGRDVRQSGERLFRNLSEGFLASGCDVTDFGAVPTPTFYHAIATGPEEAGVEITGSHNPPEFNGFKIVEGNSSFFGPRIQELKVLLEKEDFLEGSGKLDRREVLDDYVEDLAGRIHLQRLPRFAYDCGNGAAGLVASRLFAKLGLHPVSLFEEPDGSFPNHHPDPTIEANLQDLRRRVLKDELEFGVAYDGDADRIGVVDERGEILWGDRLLVLYARDLISRHPGAGVIFDIKCSQTLSDAISAAGGEPIIWKTGHSLIKQKMKQTGALLAGEMSGHMFFAENYHGFDDALFATLKLLEIVSVDRTPLSERLADVPLMESTPELRVDCPDEHKFEIVEHVKEHFRKLRPIIDIDGVRVSFDQGWALVRASNTQPSLVLRVEAENVAAREEYHSHLLAAIRDARQEIAGED